MVVIVKDAGSRSEGATRGQPSDDARRSDGSLYVRVLGVERAVNEILGDVLAKMNQQRLGRFGSLQPKKTSEEGAGLG
jgi:hypothetical protein